MNILLRDKTPHICIIGNGWWGKGLREALALKNYNVTVFNSKSCLRDLLTLNCDLVFECTGDIEAAKTVAELCLEKGVDMMTVNSEFDCHYGPYYASMFKLNNIQYCGCLGDQPGSLVKLHYDVGMMGFDTVALGICKGFINKYQTVEEAEKWTNDDQDPYKINSFADGTKLNIEAACVCNHIDANPAMRGMFGMDCPKEDLAEEFGYLAGYVKDRIIDYTVGVKGINQEAGIFVVGMLKNATTKMVSDMKYLKMGDGPYYLFFKDYHLCYFEAVTSITEMVDHNVSYIKNRYLNADVISIAKRNLSEGTVLDCIGGNCIYGEIDKVTTIESKDYIPTALIKGLELNCNVSRDTPITFDMVK